MKNISRVIHPPRTQHARLRQPMTAGEKKIFDLFNTRLDPAWEIYIQPHLNGLRPDFVLLNPSVGICVVEVKDWNLDAMNYHLRDHRTGRLELYATKEDRSFRVENPFVKIRQYKDAIYNIYCPRLANRSGYAAIVASVVFPFADRGRVLGLQSPFLKDLEREKAKEYWPIGGRDEIASGDLHTILPILRRDRHTLMAPALADDLRGWLVEPDFAQAQRQPLELDRNQRQLAESRTQSGYRRIKGPAGSGKSLVLAARAARLADEGKNVLIATFNMTLWHYLRDLIVRAATRPGYLDRLTFVHFHEWCKDVCREAGFDDEYAAIMKPVAEIMDLKLDPKEEAARLRPILPPILDEKLPELARQAAASDRVTKYDAVLVDEGQDYLPLWWNALREICEPEGERLLVADATQDLYGTAKRWTEEAMTDAGFRGGRWAELDVSYRMPPDAIHMAQDFARRFLPTQTRDLPELDQGSLQLFPCDLRWVQCDPQDAQRECVNAVLALMHKTGRSGLANADITFLANDIDFGREVVDDLEAVFEVNCAHTFEREKLKQNRRKMAFYLGDSRVKATTLHSFKGWESRMIVIYVRRAMGPEGMAAIYAGLTRLKRSPDGSYLTVVCSAPELADFGSSWSPQDAAALRTRDDRLPSSIS